MKRRYGWLLLQMVVSVGLLVLLFRQLDWKTLVSVLARVSVPFYLGSLLIMVFGQALYALRWRIILGGMGAAVPFADVLRQHLIGIFFSNLMPTAVGGDAAKVFYLGRRVGYAEAGASVFVDRFIGFFWLSILGAALAWQAAVPAPLFILNRNLLTLFAVGVVGILAVAWLVPVEQLMTRLPAHGRWAVGARRVADLVRLVRKGCARPATLAAALAIVVVFLTLYTAVYVRYFAISGTPVAAWLPVTLILVSMAVFMNVPITVNGIGLREQMHYLLFAALGVPKEVAISIALLVFSHQLLLSAVGCAIWLRIRPLSTAPAS